MKHIVLTGGGTAGHVTTNIALIPRLQELGYKISYIGSYEGIEKKLIEELGIPYYGISSGKLRASFCFLMDATIALKAFVTFFFSVSLQFCTLLIARVSNCDFRPSLFCKREQISN